MARKPDEQEYKEFKKIQELNENLANSEVINLFYYDESGFLLDSNIPYAWQEKGRELTIKKSRSKNITISGFLSNNGQSLKSYKTIGFVNSEMLVKIFDDFSTNISKETVVILDNASTHTSKLFSSSIEKWNNLGLKLLFLPPYSPQLNKIETLWRFIKYQWLDISSYLSFENLDNNLEKILLDFGSKCTINFS